MPSVPDKSCQSCGRRIAWRKKWERDWDSVRYCSKSCRANKPGESDRALESAILTLLHERHAGASICPSEAARRIDADGWSSLMEPARRAARRLVDRGQVVITQNGTPVDPSTATGPIRIRMA